MGYGDSLIGAHRNRKCRSSGREPNWSRWKSDEREEHWRRYCGTRRGARTKVVLGRDWLLPFRSELCGLSSWKLFAFLEDTTLSRAPKIVAHRIMGHREVRGVRGGDGWSYDCYDFVMFCTQLLVAAGLLAFGLSCGVATVAGFGFDVLLSLVGLFGHSPFAFSKHSPSKDLLNGTVDTQFAKPSCRWLGGGTVVVDCRPPLDTTHRLGGVLVAGCELGKAVSRAGQGRCHWRLADWTDCHPGLGIDRASFRRLSSPFRSEHFKLCWQNCLRHDVARDHGVVWISPVVRRLWFAGLLPCG